jgi:hypothetical protein
MRGHGKKVQKEREAIDCLVASGLKKQEGHCPRSLIREAAVTGTFERGTGW